jgi:Flp pilus assembly protein TadG
MRRKLNLRKAFPFVGDERGSALVEFAVTVPLLIFLLFAVLQGMVAMYVYHYTAYAAQQGARFAMVRGNTWGQACSTSAPPNFTMVYSCTANAQDIQNYVQSLGAINPTSLTINTTSSYVWPGTTPDGATGTCTPIAYSKNCLVKVTTYYTFNVVPFIPFTGVTMSATSEKAILQ